MTSAEPMRTASAMSRFLRVCMVFEGTDHRFTGDRMRQETTGVNRKRQKDSKACFVGQSDGHG